jgi:tRNA-splicing ligase RtcB
VTYKFIKTERAPLKIWCDGVEVEDEAINQLRNIASLPFVFRHVAAMPDIHAGKGATVGSVIATKGAIIPAAVGVDIGCGMMAWQTTLKASDLPENLHSIRNDIEAAIPHGRTDNGGKNDRGAWGDVPAVVSAIWDMDFDDDYKKLTEKHPKITTNNSERHLGTLGTGNHFVELCLDENDKVWVMLHSGSRGLGNRIGSYFIERAKKEMEKWFIHLPDSDLAYIPEGSELFDDYVAAVDFAQRFAEQNRVVMMNHILKAISKHLPSFGITERAVNCHHNYIAKEKHFGSNVWVTRKGAVRARKNDFGIIPGSMGTGSFIVRGLGNEESFCSCSHGAGRRMSRTVAKRKITLEEHIQATEGIECRKDADVLDESPAAYKDIGAVMAAQNDLIEIVHRLRQILNVKG